MITKQGQSQIATEIKERGLFSAFEANLWLHRRKISFAPYFHFDLNSGCGFNYEVNCMGSPLAFLNAVELVKTQNFISVFCDNDSEKIAVLKNRAEIATDERCSCVCEDNKSLLLKIPDFIRSKKEKLEYATGMILSDPNGTDVPIDELSMISKELPRIDIAINFGSSSFKRCRGAFGESRPNLESMIHSLNKKHWYIREPIGRQQWTILVGRNVLVGSVKEMNELGFYGLDSSSGQDIFSRCNYTKEELSSFGNFYPANSIVSQSSMKFDQPKPKRKPKKKEMDVKYSLHKSIMDIQGCLYDVIETGNISILRRLVDNDLATAYVMAKELETHGYEAFQSLIEEYSMGDKE